MSLMEPYLILVMAGVGLVAGTLGGLLGVGGSVIMIPAMLMLMGQGEKAGFDQHLYQAAAMVVNVLIAAPSAYRHRRAGAVLVGVWRWLVPSAIVGILIGVWISNQPMFSGNDGVYWLQRLFGVFTLYIAGFNLWKIIQPRKKSLEETLPKRVKPSSTCGVGGIMGIGAGLLGIGGGAVAVPLQQVWLKLPLRNCIANSAATIWITALFGASYKLMTLSEHGGEVGDALTIALTLAPTAILGGLLGARLTHTLPVKHVRIAFVVLMVVVGVRLLTSG